MVNFIYELQDNDGGLIFNSAMIERMEMLILGALKWQMRSVNPFSFLNYFVSLFDSGDDERLIQALKNREAQIIFKSQHDLIAARCFTGLGGGGAIWFSCAGGKYVGASREGGDERAAREKGDGSELLVSDHCQILISCCNAEGLAIFGFV
ncbi:hypothetical protein SASPL_138085 [Salvia splendens]|uniref:Uncharacterized protein n=1 Tax=Salvia splendens TaxID=180675 RepID=A0A8X8WSW0_SALSN|nr:hypothetical protein SASPL_138085 [Salvia splendens]